MVYHEIKFRGKRRYNYLVHNVRHHNKWKKIRKYTGEGDISRKELSEQIEVFKRSLKKAKYLSMEQIAEVERIRNIFDSYLKKAGSAGVEKFNEWFFTELTYNSNAIEGTSLNLRETSLIINEDIVPRNASLREVNEARNHKEALQFLLHYKGDVNEGLILKVHSIILKSIDNKNAGAYRNIPLFIVGENVRFPPYKSVPELMRRLILWYKQNKNIIHPFELATIFSMRLVSIHPFVDGNGRVSRLLMNYILKKNGYPEINIYVKHRNNYLKAVRMANDESYTLIIDFLFRTLKKNYSFLEE